MTVKITDLKFILPQTHAIIKKYIISKNDLYISIAGSIGKIGIIPDSLDGSNLTENAAKITDLRNVDKRFLCHFLNSNFAQEQIKDLIISTNQPKLALFRIEKITTPIAPHPEQLRIVSRIEELFSRLDAGVEALQKAKAQLRRYRQAVLKATVEGRLTEEWRKTHPMVETAEMLRERIQEEMRIKLGKKYAPSNVDSESLPKLPIGWIWISIEQVALVETGATPLRSNPKYYDEGEIPWVTSGSLNDSFVTEADEFITELAIKETNAKVFPINALLVAMYGEGKTRGKVSELLIEASTNQACAALLFEGKAESIKSYIKIFFEKNYEDIRRLSSGGVQPNLNLSIIKATKIPLPPLKELELIVKEIENNFTRIGEVTTVLDQDLKVADRLCQSILKRAFEGMLVPQDPSDEPASVLLERIKAERTKEPPRRGRRNETSQMRLIQ